jgi:hypothetical protein
MMNEEMPKITLALLIAILLPTASWAQFPAPQAPAPPPASPQAPASANTDPRIAQVRAAVERQGQRVSEITVVRNEQGYLVWIVFTSADYSQPSAQKVIAHASSVWWSTWNVVSGDPPNTVMISAQQWSKYIIGMKITNQAYTAFVSAYRAATTDAQRSAAFDDMLKRSSVEFFDIETKRLVDNKDFIDKNFAR